MPSLSYVKTPNAKPVAVVRGGDKDGSIVYLNTDDTRRSAGAGAEGRVTAPKDLDAAKYARDLEPFTKPAERVKLLRTLTEAALRGDELSALSAKVPDGALDLPSHGCRSPQRRAVNG